ncbi:unnamed protein product [Brassica rapa subsp. trilocularis]
MFSHYECNPIIRYENNLRSGQLANRMLKTRRDASNYFPRERFSETGNCVRARVHSH